jgi:hypothetical protein
LLAGKSLINNLLSKVTGDTGGKEIKISLVLHHVKQGISLETQYRQGF